MKAIEGMKQVPNLCRPSLVSLASQRHPALPVMGAARDLLYLASSLSRNAQTLAASSGWPILDNGTRSNILTKWLGSIPDAIGVLIAPLF